MKAVICSKYGPPEVLQVKRIDKPVPESNEILIKIMASDVNSADVRVRGLDVNGFIKTVMRFVLGFNKPRKSVLGTVFSGTVEKVGKKVSNFNAGDEVYGITGFKFGAYAEYITLSDKSVVAIKPFNATFEEAAAIPFGRHTAVYFWERAKISGTVNAKVLIYGATGAVGTAAIQIAQYYNARITAVCSENGQALVKELGVSDIVLYDREDFTKMAGKYDVVFDAAGKTSKKQCFHLLADKGRFVTVAGLESAKERKEQLEFLRKLFENGKYKAIIDRIHSIDEIVEAHRYVDEGHKKGNVVIKLQG